MILPTDSEMTRRLEDIFDNSETTVGYEDGSHVMPINAVSPYQAIPKIIAYIRSLATS